MGLAIRSCAGLVVIWTLILAKVGQKPRMNLGDDLSFFFGDHLLLDEKTVLFSIKTLFRSFWRPPTFGRKKRCNFSEDLFFMEITSVLDEETD